MRTYYLTTLTGKEVEVQAKNINALFEKMKSKLAEHQSLVRIKTNSDRREKEMLYYFPNKLV